MQIPFRTRLWAMKVNSEVEDMGHSFKGSSCLWCGCSIHSFAATEECRGDLGRLEREDEVYDDLPA